MNVHSTTGGAGTSGHRAGATRRTTRVARMLGAALALALLPACLSTRTAAPVAVAPPPPSPDAELEELLTTLRQRPPARTAARDALIARGADIVPRILPLLTDADWAYRWEIVTLLGAIRDERGIPGLAERVLADENPHVRWRALFAIAVSKGGTAAAPGLFHPELASANPSRRWNAAVGLAFFDDPRALPHIYESLASTDNWVRWEAVNAFKRVHDEQTTRKLEPIVLHDPDASVRREAVLSLGTSCGEGAGDLLIRVLGLPDPELRWRAAMKLKTCGGARAAGALRDRLVIEAEANVRTQIEQTLKALERK